jgi:hypothetical protein
MCEFEEQLFCSPSSRLRLRMKLAHSAFWALERTFETFDRSSCVMDTRRQPDWRRHATALLTIIEGKNPSPPPHLAPPTVWDTLLSRWLPFWTKLESWVLPTCKHTASRMRNRWSFLKKNSVHGSLSWVINKLQSRSFQEEFIFRDRCSIFNHGLTIETRVC